MKHTTDAGMTISTAGDYVHLSLEFDPEASNARPSDNAVVSPFNGLDYRCWSDGATVYVEPGRIYPPPDAVSVGYGEADPPLYTTVSFPTERLSVSGFTPGTTVYVYLELTSSEAEGAMHTGPAEFVIAIEYGIQVSLGMKSFIYGETFSTDYAATVPSGDSVYRRTLARIDVSDTGVPKVWQVTIGSIYLTHPFEGVGQAIIVKD